MLRSFVCPICKATGDFTHTQRYCPRKKDSQFPSGASLTELKKKKNAAGNFPNMKRMTWPIPSYPMMRNSYTGTTMVKSARPSTKMAMSKEDKEVDTVFDRDRDIAKGHTASFEFKEDGQVAKVFYTTIVEYKEDVKFDKMFHMDRGITEGSFTNEFEEQ